MSHIKKNKKSDANPSTHTIFTRLIFILNFINHLQYIIRPDAFIFPEISNTINPDIDGWTIYLSLIYKLSLDIIYGTIFFCILIWINLENMLLKLRNLFSWLGMKTHYAIKQLESSLSSKGWNSHVRPSSAKAAQQMISNLGWEVLPYPAVFSRTGPLRLSLIQVDAVIFRRSNREISFAWTSISYPIISMRS